MTDSAPLSLGEKIFNFVSVLNDAGGQVIGWDYGDPITGSVASLYSLGTDRAMTTVFGEDASTPWWAGFVETSRMTGNANQTVFTLTEEGREWHRAQLVQIAAAAIVHDADK